MSHSQYIREEVARLIVEGRVILLYEVDGTAIYLVDGETCSCQVHLKPDGTVSCTCTGWTHWGEVCLHILASQCCHHVQEVIR